MNQAVADKPAITYTAVESSQLTAIGYDSSTQTLGIKFKGPNPVAYHYAGVTAEVFAEMKASPSLGTFFGKRIRNVYPFEKQPAEPSGIVFGLLPVQEPKYTTSSKTGRLVNRDTGKPIPDDEPVMVFRAQDKRAVPALWGYFDSCTDLAHRDVIRARISDFEKFAKEHLDRMKEPDTTLLPVHSPA
jgi:hypothetical protein